MTDPIADVANYIATSDQVGAASLAMRYGVVVAINSADNSFSMNMSGDTSTVITGVKCLTSFQPTIGDTIVCLKQGTDVVGIGKLSTSTAGAYGQAQNFVTANNVITTSAGFFTLTSSPNSVTMIKRYSTSNLLVNLSITGWADVTSGGLTSAVSIGGVDYICGSVNMDLRGDSGGDTWLQSPRLPSAGSTVISGLAAGSVTAIIRIKSTVNTSHLHVDTGDFYSLTIQEVL